MSNGHVAVIVFLHKFGKGEEDFFVAVQKELWFAFGDIVEFDQRVFDYLLVVSF